MNVTIYVKKNINIKKFHAILQIHRIFVLDYIYFLYIKKNIMKSLVLMFSFLLIGALSVDAQSCSKASAGKACCASKKAAATTSFSASSEADLAAEADGNITKRTCEISGTTAYYQKNVCEKSGNVNWEEVQFDATTKKFTKVASATMEKDATTGEVVKKETKACCKGDKSKSCSAKSSKKACAAEKDAE